MKRLFSVLAGLGFTVMLLGGCAIGESVIIPVIIAICGLGIFAGSEYVVDWLEWAERRENR